MHKHALALAVLLAPATALANPVLYGKFNVTLGQVETDDGATAADSWQLTSNSSRIGIKGESASDVAGLKGLYYAEYAVDVDGDGAVFSQRNTYLGLKGNFGTARFGRMDTPLKDVQGKVEQFGDMAGDIENLMGGKTRANNALHYTSPKFGGGLVANLGVYPAEGNDIDNADGDNDIGTGVETGLADTVSASIAWDSDGLFAALAFDRAGSGARTLDGFTDLDGTTAGTQAVADIVRGVVAWKTDHWELGALYQVAEDAADGGTAEDSSWVIAGAWLAGNWKLKAQYGVTEGDTSNRERTLTAVGADYKLGKSTTLFGYWSEVDNDPLAAARPTTTTLALGIDQRF